MHSAYKSPQKSHQNFHNKKGWKKRKTLNRVKRLIFFVWHHISYNAYLIHSTIISHTFYNQLIYLIQKHKLRVQYLIHFLLIRKSRIISHTIKVNSTFILHTLQIRAKCWFRRSWRSLWWWTPNSLVDGIIGMTKCRWSWEPAVLLWSEEAETKQQCGQTTSPNCIRFQSSVRLSEVRLG